MMPISGMAVSSILLSFLSCCEMPRVIFYTIRYFLLCLTLSIHPSLIPSPRHKVMSSNYFYHALTEFTELVLPLWLTAIIRYRTDMSIFCLQLSNWLWKSSIFLKKKQTSISCCTQEGMQNLSFSYDLFVLVYHIWGRCFRFCFILIHCTQIQSRSLSLSFTVELYYLQKTNTMCI